MRNYLLTFGLMAALISPVCAQEKRAQRGIFGAGQPGEVSVVRMEAKKLGLQNFQMESRQVDGRLAIDAFSSNLGGGVLSGRGLVDWSQPENVQRMAIQVQNVEAMALFRAFKVKLDANVAATVNGTIETQWQGVRGTMPRQTMNGTVRLVLGPGSITGAEILQKVASYTGIAEVQQVEFSSALIEGTIQNGMMSITKAEVNGNTKAAKGVGLLDLRTEEVKIQFTAFVSPDMVARSSQPQVRAIGNVASSASKGNLIKMPLNIVMGGQIRDPQFSLSWANALRKEAAGN